MLPVEVQQLLEGVIADNIAIEDEEESVGVAFFEFFFCIFNRSGSSQCLMLLGIDELNSVLALQRREHLDDLCGLGVDGHNFVLLFLVMMELLSGGIGTSAVILLLVWQLMPRMISLTPIFARA